MAVSPQCGLFFVVEDVVGAEGSEFLGFELAACCCDYGGAEGEGKLYVSH